ncbi:uncharacterized protein [Callorhinus ursinus]|uniref:uncharacterized protein n=1 Tax=Callorhinus ursinus TaxID=34884 RepID=UPI003CD00667
MVTQCGVLQIQRGKEGIHKDLRKRFPFHLSHSRFPTFPGEGVPSTTAHPICAFVGQTRRPLLPSPAQTTPPRSCRAERRRGYCADGRFRRSPLVSIGKCRRTRLVRVGARSGSRGPWSLRAHARPHPLSGTQAPLELAHARALPFKPQSDQRRPGGWRLGPRGTRGGAGAAAAAAATAPPPPPLLLERSMSATRAKKVKMATKSCPECDQQVPVACKSCPCGYVFINRKLLKVKQRNHHLLQMISRQLTEWEKYLQITYLIRDLYP